MRRRFDMAASGTRGSTRSPRTRQATLSPPTRSRPPTAPGGLSRAARSAAFILSATAFCLTTPAHAIVGDSRALFGLDGSVRTLAGLTFNYDDPLLFGFDNKSDGFGGVTGRLVAGGVLADWLSYEAHLVQSVNLSTLGAAGLSPLAQTRLAGGAYRALPLTWRQLEEDVSASLELDRLAFTFRTQVFDLTVGRQALTFGKAYFWNPLDVFVTFDALAFDRDYKTGVDALRVEVPLGEVSGLTLVGAVGQGQRGEVVWYRSGLLARAYTTWLGWDLQVQGGKVLGGWHLGAGTSGEVGPLAVRAEGAYLFRQAPPDRLRARGELPIPSHFAGVVGVGHLFESSLDLELEYFYNGAGRLGLSRAFLLSSQGLIRQASEHLLGAVASYELHALLRGSLALIASLDAPSLLIQPGVVYSAADEVEVLAGAMVATGKRPGGATLSTYGPQSELGTYPHIFYVQMKAYF